jgi:H+-translocating NAD(P) transhydrogenase subunit beta
MTNQYILNIIYLFASVTFVIGLQMLGGPQTARRGNLWAAFGMTLAVIATIIFHEGEVAPIIYILIATAIGIGSIIGWISAKKVKMTSMPEMVSLFNGMGGACAALISLLEFHHNVGSALRISIIMAGMIIGSVSFSGSIVAFLKLNGTMRKSVRLPNYNFINLILMLLPVVLAVYISYSGTDSNPLLYTTFFLALIYGIFFVMPIGGADMPVVISLLNSFTGLAAAFGGFLYNNQVMLTGGILVGSAGTILTLAMCKAMNRPLFNVIFGAFGESAATGAATSMHGTIKDINITDAAVLLNYSKKVIIVPGYGLAVAQAQHIIHDLEMLLEERGVDVKYAIHPVAGRMPGHMNVLLAESNVDYGKLSEMDEVNPEFATTDVVLVVGANDVVNPAAKTDPSSPIYGMPILDVENSRHIIINKRSMNAGYAGIENQLFYDPKTSMLFGDAKDVLVKLVNELKTL